MTQENPEGWTPDEQTERADVGASVEVKMTRGTGTRDQEQYRLKGKGADADEAVAELAVMLDRVFGPEVTHADRPLADALRDVDPSREADDG